MSYRLQKHCRHNIVEYTVAHDSQRCVWPAAWPAVAAVAVAVAAPALPLPTVTRALLAAVVLLFGLLLRAGTVASESLVVLQGVGVLLLSQRRWWGESRQFLDLADMHSVFIHETLTTTNIHTHLAFLSNNSDELAVAFPNMSPRLEVLVPLYNELQQQLGLVQSEKAQGQ